MPNNWTLPKIGPQTVAGEMWQNLKQFFEKNA